MNIWDSECPCAVQDWLRRLDHAPPFTGRGLGPEYYDSPQKFYDWAGGFALATSAVYLSLKYL
eukprot:scaffold373240_cov47-Prasinocladus_malaysianus.AAC.1